MTNSTIGGVRLADFIKCHSSVVIKEEVDIDSDGNEAIREAMDENTVPIVMSCASIADTYHTVVKQKPQAGSILKNSQTENVPSPVATEKKSPDDNTIPKNDVASKCNKYCPKCKKRGYKLTRNVCKKCDVPYVFQCKICEISLTTYKRMLYHLRTKCDKIYHYSCPYNCNFSTNIRYYLHQHYKSAHGIKKMHECKICKEWFTSVKSLMKHRKCCEIEAAARYENRLKINEKRKKKKIKKNPVSLDSLEIEVRDVEYENFDTMKGFREQTKRYCLKCDIVVEHDPEVGVMGRQKCDVCDNPMHWQCKKCISRYISHSSMEFHVRHKCYVKKLYRCLRCKSFETPVRAYILIHYNNKHSDKKDVKILKCTKCKSKKTFKNEITLQNHIRRCGGEKKYQCANCSYRTYSKFNLSKHIRSMHKSTIR